MPRCQVLVSSIQLLVIIAFLANLSEVDEWKWLISFAVPCLDGEKRGKLTWRRIMENYPLVILLNHCYSILQPVILVIMWPSKNDGPRFWPEKTANGPAKLAALIFVAQSPSSTHFVASTHEHAQKGLKIQCYIL